jgi:hypothetical protein
MFRIDAKQAKKSLFRIEAKKVSLHFDQRKLTTKFFKAADQGKAQALFLNSGPAIADYGKIAGAHL